MQDIIRNFTIRVQLGDETFTYRRKLIHTAVTISTGSVKYHGLFITDGFEYPSQAAITALLDAEEKGIGKSVALDEMDKHPVVVYKKG